MSRTTVPLTYSVTEIARYGARDPSSREQARCAETLGSRPGAGRAAHLGVSCGRGSCGERRRSVGAAGEGYFVAGDGGWTRTTVTATAREMTAVVTEPSTSSE